MLRMYAASQVSGACQLVVLLDAGLLCSWLSCGAHAYCWLTNCLLGAESALASAQAAKDCYAVRNVGPGQHRVAFLSCTRYNYCNLVRPCVFMTPSPTYEPSSCTPFG